MIRQNWKELSFIQIGGAICLPLLLIGFEIGKKVPFSSAIGLCLLGNGLLTLLAIGIGKLALKERTTTSQCIASVLGETGGAIAASLIMVSMLSWFSIQTAVIVQDVLFITGNKNSTLIFSGAAILLMVMSCLYGLKAIERLSRIAAPLMAVTLAYVACTQDTSASFVVEYSKDLSQGILIIVGGTIMAVIDLPTFFRTAHSQKEVVKASIASFLVGVSFVELMGAYLASTSQSKDLIQTLLQCTHPLFIALFIFVAGWTTNVANLYSGAIACQSLFPKIKERQAVVLLGLIALLLVPVDIFAHMEKILEIIAVVTIALGAEMARAAFLPSVEKRSSTLCVTIGALFGVGELVSGVTISGLALIDVFVITIVLSQLIRRQNEARI